MSMVSIELDMIQTAGIGALALIVGMVLTRKVAFLQKFCVPSPVSGGIIFSLITLILYGPSIDSHLGISGVDDGAVCIFCSIPSVRSRL